MSCKGITCPETGRREVIEIDETPVGALVLHCTRFRPACAITCSRMCASQFDRADDHCDLDIDVALDVRGRVEDDSAQETVAAIARRR